jgi:hypothetical protein
MSANRALPHVLVLPEDDANRQIAIGFELELDGSVQRQFQILNPPGGWTKVLETFESDHVGAMDRNPRRFLILLIDFDNNIDRLAFAKGKVPQRLADRVFVLGALSKPESLRSAGLGSYEEIGTRMAKDCLEEDEATWSHELLNHNADELSRLRTHIVPILFRQSENPGAPLDPPFRH